MISHQAKQVSYLVGVVDATLLATAFVTAFAIRSLAPIPFLEEGIFIDLRLHTWLVTLGIPLYWFLANRGGLYDLSFRGTPFREILRALRVFTWLSALLGAAIFVLQLKETSRGVFFLFLALGFVSVVGLRLTLAGLSRRVDRVLISRRNVLVVGTGTRAREICQRIEAHPELGMRIVGHVLGPGETEVPSDLGVLGGADRLREIVEEQVVDDVVFALPPAQIAACDRHFAWCEEVGLTAHVRTDFVRTLFARSFPTELDGIPMLTVSPTPRDPVQLLVKRVLDLTISFVGLVALSPALLLIALLVRLTSQGPTFFRQERVGLNGRLFTLYKFRSMYVDAEARKQELLARNEVDGPVFKIRRDPRVTPVGRWLRRFSLDELPQLWNVLQGDMSLVGPRPPLPEEVQKYERWQRRRLSMKPGITCLWQVSGRNQLRFEEWMRLDLHYIDNWSLKLDLKILARTVPAVLAARGAS